MTNEIRDLTVEQLEYFFIVYVRNSRKPKTSYLGVL